jgi:hypothetical protein
MENVRYTLLFDVTVTEDDLIQYYIQRGITDYPKRKDGRPNMLRVFNKNNHTMLYELKHEAVKDKYKELIIQKTKDKEAEMCKLIETTFHTENCVICNESLSSVSILSCGHKFCMNCSISHFRVNNVCPLCRKEICDKPKSVIAMSPEMVDQAIEEVLHTHEPEREGLMMRDYIKDKLIFFKKNNIINTERYINDMYNEIKHCIYDFNVSIERWYMS